VDGELVRLPLQQFLLAKGISAVRIFYFTLVFSPGGVVVSGIRMWL
jgi:hypothetical protein